MKPLSPETQRELVNIIELLAFAIDELICALPRDLDGLNGCESDRRSAIDHVNEAFLALAKARAEGGE